jgi:NADH:ubiquinone oxidoreductase subunit
MKRAFRFCLLFYPRRHRDQFADEMLSVFEQACAEQRRQRGAWYIRFAFSEMAGLVGGAAEAWLDQRSPSAPAAAQCTPRGWMRQDLADAQQRVDANVAAMVHAIANHQFERARILSNQEREARENLRILRERYGDEYGMNV